jgi:hypothetical protein
MTKPLIIEQTEDPWKIIDSPWGELPAFRVQGLANGAAGALEALHNVYQAVRNDAAEATARADAIIAKRDTEIRGQIVKLITGLDTLTARVDSIEAENRAAKADAARKAAFDAEVLTLPPGDPPDPSLIEDASHHPGGELHDIAPKEEDKEPDPSLEVEDDTSRQGSGDQGTLPTQLQKGVPPAPSTYPNMELPKPPVVAQPTAVSLNQE